MNRSQAIKAHCLECSGDSAKEVTLCVMFDCPLYPYRFGNSPGAKAYKERMATAKRNYPSEMAEIFDSCVPASSKTRNLQRNDLPDKELGG